MPKNIDPGQRAQKKDARKGAAFFALVQLAMGTAPAVGQIPAGRTGGAGLAAAAPVDPGSGRPGDHPGRVVVLKQRMKEIEEESWMLLVNIEYIPGKEIEALGMVKGTVVQSKNFGKDFMAGMKTLVGGEITGYTEMLNEARQIAVKRMVDEAEALGADAVINVRYGSSSVMQGAAEVIAYGTAVKYK